MSLTRYTACVVGGGMGGKLSLNALHQSDRFDLVAACDLRAEVRAELEGQFPGLRTFADHRAMFEQCPTDVVCVSTWPPSHEEVTLDALRLPLRGILVEKPLAHTAAAGRRTFEAVRQRGLPMATPHNLHTSAHSIEILRLVHEGAIGELKLVEIECTQWDIINAGIHWLNFFVALTDNEAPAGVLCQCDTSTRTWRDGMQVETVAVTYVWTVSGKRAVLHSGDVVPISRDGKSFLFRLVGTAGVIEFWGWENGYRIQNAAHPAGELVTPAPLAVSGHRLHLENLAAQIDAGQPDYRIPEGSLLALELCEAAYVSHRHRCAVTFPLASFAPPALSDWDPGQPYAGTGGGRDGRQL